MLDLLALKEVMIDEEAALEAEEAITSIDELLCVIYSSLSIAWAVHERTATSTSASRLNKRRPSAESGRDSHSRL